MELKNYKEINAGCLKATFTVKVPEWADMEFDSKYFVKGDQYWLNHAPREYEKDGKKKSWNQCRWPPETTEKLNRAIREKILAMQTQPVKPINEQYNFQEDNLPF